MKSVYSAVRTGSLNKAVCVPSLKDFKMKMYEEDGTMVAVEASNKG